MATTPATTPDDVSRHGAARGRPLLVGLFVVYLALLVWVVLWKLEVPWVGIAAARTVKLVPFAATARAGASAPGEVLLNAVLFVPFGVYLAVLAPRWRWWTVAAVVAAASLSLEVAQYVLAVGRSDITDVLVNTAGGLVGLALIAAGRPRAEAVVTWVCAAGTVVALLATAVVVVGPLQLGPPDSHARAHRHALRVPPGASRPPAAPRPGAAP